MPTYQYRCQICEQDFEVIQTMADKPLKRVPSTGPCGSKCKSPATRVLSVPNINRRQGQTEAVRDDRGHITQTHWDGRQDVTINAEPVTLSTGVNG